MEEDEEVSSTEMGNDMPERSYACNSSLDKEISSPRSSTPNVEPIIDSETRLLKLEDKLLEVGAEKRACAIEMDTCFKKCQLKWEMVSAEWSKIEKIYKAECQITKQDVNELKWSQEEMLQEVRNLLYKQGRFT